MPTSTVRVWDAVTGRPIGQPLVGHEDMVWSVAFSPDGRRVVSGSADHTVRVWDGATGQPIGQPLVGHMDDVMIVAFSPDGERIVSCSWDRTVRVWDAEKREPFGQPLIGHNSRVNSVALQPRRQAHRFRQFRQDGAAVGRRHREADRPADHHYGRGRYGVAFSPDGKRDRLGQPRQTVRLWDADTGQQIGPPMKNTGAVDSVALSPDGRRIVSGDFDGSVRVWDATTGQPIGAPITGRRGLGDQCGVQSRRAADRLR